MFFKRLAYKAFHPVLRVARSHPVLVRGLFGLRLPRGAEVAFDPTTIALARAAAELIRPRDETVLELGIGAGALVGLSLANRQAETGGEIDLWGCDCVPRRVASARQVAAHNGIEAEFIDSDLFAALPAGKQFDLMLFNPPYVPTEVGESLDMGAKLTDERTMWDGGADGTDVLRRFLAEAPERLAPGGRVMFGVQHVFVSDELARRVIDESPLVLQTTFRSPRIPAMVYVLGLER